MPRPPRAKESIATTLKPAIGPQMAVTGAAISVLTGESVW
jgi:hypothetical protein